MYSQDTKKETDSTQTIPDTLSTDSSAFAPIQTLDDLKKQDQLKSDTLERDTILGPKTKQDFDHTIIYSAKDSIIVDLEHDLMFMYRKSQVDYGDIQLKSHQMVNDMNTKVLNARGGVDTSGEHFDEPVFKEKANTFEAHEMSYNFKTKKGLISQVITEQNGGYLTGDSTLKDDFDNMYISNGVYTTCNHAHPHYYFKMHKTKRTNKGTTVTDRVNMVIGDIPTPLIVPFGIFPSQGTRSSGIIFPSWGERQSRGFFLENGGYYWAVNDYIGSEFKGSIYSLGDWIFRNNTVYKKRYRYDGSAQFQLRNQRSSIGTFNETVSNEFQLTWRHTPKAYGGKSFNANVNYVTNNFTRSNIALADNTISNLNLNYSTNFRSSVNYNFPVKHTPYNGGIAVNLSQNIVTGIADMTAPQLNFRTTRIYPFKSKKAGRKSRVQNFVKTIGFTHAMNFRNQVTNAPRTSDGFSQFNVANFTPETDTIEFTPNNFGELFQKGRYGMTHTVPISASAKLGPFQLNPSFTYTDRWYFQKFNYEYVGNDSVIVDTSNTFSRVGEWNARADLTTTLYGMFQFKGKRKTAIRHSILPTVGFQYSPDFSNSNAYTNIDSAGTTIYENVSVYNGSIIGNGPSRVKRASLNFGIRNILEMKYKSLKDDQDQDDKNGGFKKLKLLENVSANGSYNFALDSFQLSDIALNARTSIRNGLLGINMSGRLDPYSYVDTSSASTIDQVRVNKLAITNGQGLGFLESVTLNLSLRLSPETFKGKERKKKKGEVENSYDDGFEDENAEDDEEEEVERPVYDDPTQYIPFEVPWSLNLSYYMNLSKVGLLDPTKREGLNIRATLNPTDKWDISFGASYDFETKQLLRPNVQLTRDLHCWIMRFEWVPTGQFRFYRLEIGVKASMLQDLKIRKTNRFVN